LPSTHRQRRRNENIAGRRISRRLPLHLPALCIQRHDKRISRPVQLKISKLFNSIGDPHCRVRHEAQIRLRPQNIPLQIQRRVPGAEMDINRSPLTIGVGLAYEFFSCLMLGTPPR